MLPLNIFFLFSIPQWRQIPGGSKRLWVASIPEQYPVVQCQRCRYRPTQQGFLVRVDPGDAVFEVVSILSSCALPYAYPHRSLISSRVLASFYYGNLTTPSVDPPRIGLVSTMPSNAPALLAAAIKAAEDNFPGACPS